LGTLTGTKRAEKNVGQNMKPIETLEIVQKRKTGQYQGPTIQGSPEGARPKGGNTTKNNKKKKQQQRKGGKRREGGESSIRS